MSASDQNTLERPQNLYTSNMATGTPNIYLNMYVPYLPSILIAANIC